MIDIKLYREMIAETTAEIPEIKKREVVVTDDEFVKFLGDQKNTDNILLIGVLPSYNGFGEEDNAGLMSYMQFFILEKVDYGKFRNNDEYLDVFVRTSEVVNKFLHNIFQMSYVECTPETLEYDVNIRPVARKSECCGYEVQIDSRKFNFFNL